MHLENFELCIAQEPIISGGLPSADDTGKRGVLPKATQLRTRVCFAPSVQYGIVYELCLPCHRLRQHPTSSSFGV